MSDKEVTQQDVADLRKKGMSYEAIGKKLNIAKNTAKDIFLGRHAGKHQDKRPLLERSSDAKRIAMFSKW